MKQLVHAEGNEKVLAAVESTSITVASTSMNANLNKNNDAQKESTQACKPISTELGIESISAASAEESMQKASAKEFTGTKSKLKKKNEMQKELGQAGKFISTV